MSYEAGTAFLQITPSYAGAIESITSKFTEYGDQAAQVFSDAFNQVLGRETSGTNVGPSDADSASQGESSGGKFADAFKAHVEAALRNLPDVAISADSTPADLKIDEIRRRLSELSNQTVGVDISDADALIKIDLLKIDLDELGRKSPSIEVKVDAAAASAELAAVTLEADAASGSSSGGGFAGLSSIVAGLPDFLSPATIGIALLATALIPLAGLAAGVTIGLVGMAVAATAGIGAFGLAVLPVFTQVSSALQQISADQTAVNRATSTAQQNTAITHLNDDLNNLSPTVRTITEGVLAFKQSFENWDAQFSPDIINVFNAALGAAQPILDALTPLVHAGAAALTEFFNSIAQVANSQAFKDFINFLAAQAGPAMQTITTVIEDLGGSFTTILEQSSPIIKDVEVGLTELFNAFGKWVKDGGFEKFVTWFQQNGAQIADDFLRITQAFVQLIPLLLPVGELVLSFVTGIADLIDNVETFVGHWRGAWADVKDAADKVIAWFETIPDQLQHIWSDTVNDLHQAWSAIAGWVNDQVVLPTVHFVENIPSAVSHVWGDVVNAIHEAWSVVAQWVSDNLVTPVVNFLESIPHLASHTWSDLVNDLEGAWNQISGWVQSEVVQPVVGWFEGLPSAAHHVWSDLVNDLEGAWKVISGWVQDTIITPVVGFFSGMPANIESALSGLAAIIEKPFNDALGAIQTVVNTVEGWLGDIGIHIGNAQSAAQNLAAATASAIPNAPDAPAPHNALGTGMGTFGPGLSWVGEQGPELVNFGTPVQIIPNSALTGAGSMVDLSDVGGNSRTNALLAQQNAILATLAKDTGAVVGQVVDVKVQNQICSAVDAIGTELAASRLV